jgi:uncharacterized membrane protein YdjX (TVP38/TMEM64 family)
MKKINPIYLFIAFNIIVFALRDLILPEEFLTAFSQGFEALIASLGAFGYASLVGIYAACSFFFIPLLIPLNILCGAIYGPYVGTAVAIVGITLGCLMSTVSVRYVFTGMQRSIENRATAQKILSQAARHGAIIVIAVRLAFIVPYLLQNIVLAASSIGMYRLTALTAVGSLPGAAIYSFLGAGLVRAENASELAIYLAVPLVLLVLITLIVRYLNAKYEAS